jgi:hypothetical protein
VRAQLDNGNITARVTDPTGVRGCAYTVVTRVYTWLHIRPAAIVLNQPGLGTPSAEGIISLRNSAQGARVLQYTARITW